MRSDSSEPAAGRVCPARALTWVVAFGTSTGTIVATGCAQERALASVSADAGGSRDGGAGAGSGAAEPTDDSLPGSPLAIDLVRGPSFISLHSLQQVNTERSNLDWDLMFDGWAIFSNGGASGPGAAAVFGPSDPLDLLFDTVPAVPLREDQAIGALSGWYDYSAGTVRSRRHVYGIESEGKRWKLQVLSYYGSDGDVSGMSAVMSLRYARVEPEGASEVVTLDGVDATSGGYDMPQVTRAACLDLDDGHIRQLDAEERASDSDWHVCFRRTEAFTNGGLSGPGSVSAADLDEFANVPSEAEVDATRDLDRFEAIDWDDLADSRLNYRTDEYITSLLLDNWVTGRGAAAQPLNAAWIVRDASGARHYGLLFTRVAEGTERGPGRVELQVKPLKARP